MSGERSHQEPPVAGPLSRWLAGLSGRPQVTRIIALWLVTVIVAAFFQSQNSAFLTQGNLLDLVRAASTLGIVAMGVTLVVIAGELDLSVGSTYALAPTVVAVLWMEQGWPLSLALPAALVCVLLAGVLNGVLTVYAKIPSFVVTLGTFTLIAGVSLQIGRGQYFTPASSFRPVAPGELDFFVHFGGASVAGVPAQIVWLVGISLLAFVLLHLSLFGFRLRAIGGNETAARLSRLPVARYRIIVFALSAGLAGLAGIIDFSFLQATQPASGSGLTFPVFAAVIIGGASLAGGSGTVIGTLTGALLLQTLANGLSLIGAGSGVQQIFTGAITIVAVGIDRWGDISSALRSALRRRRRAARQRAVAPDLAETQQPPAQP
jgi:ribose/xylose/arabinose/galactoside ABC-type transport system permease subunit